MTMFTDSLSFGLREAIDKGCEDEVVILTSCRFSTPAELEEILCWYEESYWHRHPKVAYAARRAYGEGRIIIPRIEGLRCPLGSSRFTLYESWEDWRLEVSRLAPRWNMAWCPHHCRVTAAKVLACNSVIDVCRLFPS